MVFLIFLSDKKRPFIIPDDVRPFLPLGVCWVILLIILFLRIHCEYNSAQWCISKGLENVHVRRQFIRHTGSTAC